MVVISWRTYTDEDGNDRFEATQGDTVSEGVYLESDNLIKIQTGSMAVMFSVTPMGAAQAVAMTQMECDRLKRRFYQATQKVSVN